MSRQLLRLLLLFLLQGRELRFRRFWNYPASYVAKRESVPLQPRATTFPRGLRPPDPNSKMTYHCAPLDNSMHCLKLKQWKQEEKREQVVRWKPIKRDSPSCAGEATGGVGATRQGEWSSHWLRRELTEVPAHPCLTGKREATEK